MGAMAIATKQQKREEFRRQLWLIVHHGKGMTGHAFNMLVILFIIISLALLPLELIPQLREHHDTLFVIEVISAVAFTIEYALRIYAAPKRFAYLFSLSGIIDLLSIAPFYLGLFDTQFLRALRIFRVARLLKIRDIDAAGLEQQNNRMEKAIGLIPGEKVEYVVAKHPIFLIVGCLPPLISTMVSVLIVIYFGSHPAAVSIAACLTLFGLVFLWKTWLDYSYDVIYVTNHRLICQYQYLLGRSLNQVNYSSVANINPYYPTMMSYVLRYGSLRIETPAAESGHIELHTVRNHEKAAQIIMQRSLSQSRQQVHINHQHQMHDIQSSQPTP